jgi:hypothetical protein
VLDILAMLCKQGAEGSSPPSSTRQNEPGQIMKAAIDTSGGHSLPGLPVLAAAAEASRELLGGEISLAPWHAAAASSGGVAGQLSTR